MADETQTDRGRQAELATQQRLQVQLLENLPAGAYTCDADGLITYFNQQAVDAWGRAPELNDPIDRFCGSFKLFAPDGSPIAHDKCWMAMALQTGRDYVGEEVIVERPDGTRRTVLAHANPIRDDAGELIGAVNVLIDISDRKQAEQAQALLAAIVESSDDAIVSKNLDGRILSWNGGAERLFGYTADEAIGQSITILMPPDRIDEEKSILARLRAGERIEHYETVRMSKQGRKIDISVTISPIRDATGRIVAASKVARDIAIQKRAKYALLEADRCKDEFLATLGHELRNPLAPICNSLQLLKLSDDLSPSAQRIRDIMERQVNHMVRLVDDLLEVSRISRGQISLRRERVELAPIIASAIEASRPLIEASAHQLAVTLPPQPITVEGDPMRLSQVITNLLNNAAKYTEPKGQIWLTARQENGEARISVKDTGLGIPAEMLPRVFDMFAQVDRTLARSQGGLGIGLTLAKNLIEAHSGTIEAHSAGAGQGSEFIIRLPLHTKSRRAARSQLPLPAKNASGPARRILIVDDARDAAFVLSRLLEKLGHNVRTTRDPLSALQEISLDRPDVLISDIGMPGMDGYELARRIRQRPEMQDVVLVALTGYGQASDRQRAKQAGFDHHLTKPIDFTALRDLLATLPAGTAQV